VVTAALPIVRVELSVGDEKGEGLASELLATDTARALGKTLQLLCSRHRTPLTHLVAGVLADCGLLIASALQADVLDLRVTASVMRECGV